MLCFDWLKAARSALSALVSLHSTPLHTHLTIPIPAQLTYKHHPNTSRLSSSRLCPFITCCYSRRFHLSEIHQSFAEMAARQHTNNQRRSTSSSRSGSASNGPWARGEHFVDSLLTGPAQPYDKVDAVYSRLFQPTQEERWRLSPASRDDWHAGMFTAYMGAVTPEGNYHYNPIFTGAQTWDERLRVQAEGRAETGRAAQIAPQRQQQQPQPQPQQLLRRRERLFPIFYRKKN